MSTTKPLISLESAIRKITFDIASFWGLQGRGWLREGYHADVAVFDLDTVSPSMPELVHDLPAGGPRIKQHSQGMKATVVNGVVTIEDGVHSGVLPGRLLRGPLHHN